MGVAGCGKSSLGSALAQAEGLPLIEGDDHHSPTSREKMRQGIALTDADREGWLARLAALLAAADAQHGVVLTCSALKRKYRDQLRSAQQLGFVFLDLDYATALERVQTRPGHFFSPDLVANQFTTLEDPRQEPDVLTVSATMNLNDIALAARQWARRESQA